MHFDSRSLLFVAIILAGCGLDGAQSPDPPAEAKASSCGSAGYLEGRLSGALTADIAWQDHEMTCESMPRPDDKGVRLRFSGDISGERLAIIIAVPGLEAGMTGPDIDAIVTITVEGSGRFFSTSSLGACWVDVSLNAPAEEPAGTHIVAGRVACVAPLGEFNGDAFVELRDMRFSGIAEWGNS